MPKPCRCFYSPATLACFVLFALALHAPAQNQAPSLTATNVPVLLTAKELADLKSEWTDQETSKKLSLAIVAKQAAVEPKDKEKLKASGAVPFQITATMLETRTVNGKPVSRLLTGSQATVCIYDSEGKTVVSRLVQLVDLCAS